MRVVILGILAVATIDAQSERAKLSASEYEIALKALDPDAGPEAAIALARRWVAGDPDDPKAHEQLGERIWFAVKMPVFNARTESDLSLGDPGPIPKFNLRISLVNQYGEWVEEGLQHLNRAIELEPKYTEAMWYLEELLRIRANLRDSRRESDADIAEADRWHASATRVKQSWERSPDQNRVPAIDPLARTVPIVRAGRDAQNEKLMQRVDPACPVLAVQARLSGTVALTVTIDHEGSPVKIQTLNGHPVLIPAAIAAVQNWKYHPTIFDGQAVWVVAQVDVNMNCGGK